MNEEKQFAPDLRSNGSTEGGFALRCDVLIAANVHNPTWLRVRISAIFYLFHQ
jgi:hypothetical protein